MTDVCPISSPCARDAQRLLVAAGLAPRRVYLVERDTVCFVTLDYKARTAYIRARPNGVIVVEAAVDGWPV